jgi:hypothetical protein
MILIDAELAREQFALLDPDTAAMLMRAMEDDVRRCAAQLAAAARAGDDEAMRRARHSCGACAGHLVPTRSIRPPAGRWTMMARAMR